MMSRDSTQVGMYTSRRLHTERPRTLPPINPKYIFKYPSQSRRCEDAVYVFHSNI